MYNICLQIVVEIKCKVAQNVQNLINTWFSFLRNAFLPIIYFIACKWNWTLPYRKKNNQTDNYKEKRKTEI